MEDYDDDDDEYFWLLDDPIAEADDLTQNTVQSPVWLDYDSDKEIGEIFTDVEYCSDDYYDHAPEAVTRVSVDREEAKLNSRRKQNPSQPRGKARKRCADYAGVKTGQCLDDPSDPNLTETSSSSAVVRWLKDSTFTAPPLPILADDEGEKVALLKDWRDRFKIYHRDDGKKVETESQDYEVPEVQGIISVSGRGNYSDTSKLAYNSETAIGVEAEQKPTDTRRHTSSKTTKDGAPTMTDDVVGSESGVHARVPKKDSMAANGTKSRKRHADVDDEPGTRETKRKATAIADTQPDARPKTLPSKSVARNRRGDDLSEPVEQTGIALRSQEARQHNLQHDAMTKVPVSDKKPESISDAGKENGGMSQRPAARRSTRAKRGS
ncbi:hypothetical protein MMC26_005488 [Xylographa opegraphella]|nr:hypothetical protein [Xylographa opegraphella]